MAFKSFVQCCPRSGFSSLGNSQKSHGTKSSAYGTLWNDKGWIFNEMVLKSQCKNLVFRDLKRGLDAFSKIQISFKMLLTGPFSVPVTSTESLIFAWCGFHQSRLMIVRGALRLQPVFGPHLSFSCKNFLLTKSEGSLKKFHSANNI